MLSENRTCFIFQFWPRDHEISPKKKIKRLGEINTSEQSTLIFYFFLKNETWSYNQITTNTKKKPLPF